LTDDRLESFLLSLRGYSTLAELRSSSFFAQCGGEIEELLLKPEVLNRPDTSPRVRSFLRVAQWNIEKGKRYPRILDTLRNDAHLRWADVILLNESDAGMNRSDNRHLARDLANDLEMNLVFGPAHFELTKGTDEELELPGENRHSMQGNAILSRYPVLEARVLRLPSCFEPFDFHEKRYGWRNCVWAKFVIGERSLWVGSLHLEVRNTPACRAAQLNHVFANLPGSPGEASILGGDLNSNGFPRGTLWRTLRSIQRLASTPPAVLREELCHPERRSEPLFRIAKKAGFLWEGLNSAESTASAPLGNLEDAEILPRALVRIVQKRLAPHQGYLHFKLDWLLGSGVRPLRQGQVCDPCTGVFSVDPGCVSQDRMGAGRISDHAPIFADLLV
jgi:endonuclease/exonuclease/phosphatase family metal-dependent hydrolase